MRSRHAQTHEDLRLPFADGEIFVRRWAGTGEAGDGEGDTFPAGKVPPAPARVTRKARVTFEVPRVQGPAKCTAANGRLEVRLPVDFSTVDRRKLEAAVRAMLIAASAVTG